MQAPPFFSLLIKFPADSFSFDVLFFWMNCLLISAIWFSISVWLERPWWSPGKESFFIVSIIWSPKRIASRSSGVSSFSYSMENSLSKSWFTQSMSSLIERVRGMPAFDSLYSLIESSSTEQIGVTRSLVLSLSFLYREPVIKGWLHEITLDNDYWPDMVTCFTCSFSAEVSI